MHPFDGRLRVVRRSGPGHGDWELVMAIASDKSPNKEWASHETAFCHSFLDVHVADRGHAWTISRLHPFSAGAKPPFHNP